MKIMEELYEVVIAKIAINVVRRSGEEINRLKALTGSLVYWGAEVGGLVVVPDATDGRWVNVIRPTHWASQAHRSTLSSLLESAHQHRVLAVMCAIECGQ